MKKTSDHFRIFKYIYNCRIFFIKKNFLPIKNVNGEFMKEVIKINVSKKEILWNIIY